ncbi:MAG: hypothetical protein ABIK93_08110 [candidate division WOR-3 bacterium]
MTCLVIGLGRAQPTLHNPYQPARHFYFTHLKLKEANLKIFGSLLGNFYQIGGKNGKL